jgi:O-antigen/teichoic acid export membrane protein
MQKLIDGLDRILPFLDSVKQHSRETRLRGTISALLNLIEDTSNFIVGYMSDTVVGMFPSTMPILAIILTGSVAHSAGVTEPC